MMKKLLRLVLFCAFALGAHSVHAQVANYQVTGGGVGNLTNLTAVGEATGTHFGKLSFEVFVDGSDIQVASDGSQLVLQKVDVLFVQNIFDPETGLVVTVLIDEWEIQGGTGRFASAGAVPDNNIISTAVTAPYDPADPIAVPFVFQKVGKIDLGKK